MKYKYQDRWTVQKQLSVTEKQLDRAITIMEKRHPLENWLYIREAQNGQKNLYLSLEFVKWLTDVYFNKSASQLDLEIIFYRDAIKQLKDYLHITIPEIEYRDLTLKEMMIFFNKSRNSIDVAVFKMCQALGKDLKYDRDNIVVVKAEGIKWIHENLFRRNYLKFLEEYKIRLEKQEVNNE